MTKITIEKGSEKNITDLLRLIKDLALFEKAPQEVITTEAELLEDWELGRFEYLVLLHGENETCIGISLFYPQYSTWKGFCYYLEDLFVMPEYRSLGYGKLLLDATADCARKAGAKRMDWQVLDWNDSAVHFYNKVGADIEKEWWNCKWWLHK
jgi:GNAT superfamily N-acetyltransferase